MRSVSEQNGEDIGYFCCLGDSRKHAYDKNKICSNFLLYNHVIKTHSHCKEYSHENTTVPFSIPPFYPPDVSPFLLWCVSAVFSLCIYTLK